MYSTTQGLRLVEIRPYQLPGACSENNENCFGILRLSLCHPDTSKDIFPQEPCIWTLCLVIRAWTRNISYELFKRHPLTDQMTILILMSKHHLSERARTIDYSVVPLS